MATTTLGNIAVGSVIKINENGVPVDFYVAKHDYESGLNGMGRTLVVRKSCHSNGEWHSSNVNSYASSAMDSWLNSTYKGLLDADIQSAIGATEFYYTAGKTTNVTTLTRAIFLLSVTELGRSTNYANIEGSELPIASTLQIARSNGNIATDQWTRTPYTAGTNRAYFVDTDGELGIVAYCSYEHGTRPAFTLPSNLTVRDNGFVSGNIMPTITGSIASGSDLGRKDAGFAFTYTVNDADGPVVTVKEYLDGSLMRSYTATLGATNTFECVSAANYQKILNGTHTLKIVANDGKEDSDEYTVTFSKKITTATVTLANALEADDLISVAAVAVLGEIPADAVLQVLVTNNANDPSPVWEDATSSILAGSNHVFTNQTAVNGFAFNFRLTVTRGESDTGGYITGIGGAFQ